MEDGSLKCQYFSMFAISFSCSLRVQVFNCNLCYTYKHFISFFDVVKSQGNLKNFFEIFANHSESQNDLLAGKS